jgi:hypothetical protein
MFNRAVAAFSDASARAPKNCHRHAGVRCRTRWRRGRRLPEAEQQFQSAQRRPEEFDVVSTGALRQAALLPLQADAQPRADDVAWLRARPALHEEQFCRTSDDVRIA